MVWSVNCRLIVAQLTLALILVYMYNISKLAQLDRLRQRSSEFDHLPHPVHPRRGIDEDGGRLQRQRSPALPQELSRSQHAGQSDVVRCPNARKPNATLDADWRRQDHLSGTMYIYTAVYDGRSDKGASDSVTVRLLVLASGLEDRDMDIYCQIWYTDVSEPAVVRAGLIELDADVRRRSVIYAQYVISCQLEQSTISVDGVSVVIGDRCGSSSTLVPIQRPAAATETPDVGICAVLAWPLSGDSTRKRAVRLSPWLVEWMELQLTVFSASRVFLYVAFDDDLRPLRQLVRLYTDRKSLVVRRIPHPVEGRKRQRQETIGNLRALAVNDCLLRNAPQFRYLIHVDVDELIVPRHVAVNYSDMIARIHSVVNKRPPKPHGALSSTPIVYFFHMVSFFLDVPTDEPNSSPRLTTTGYFRSRDKLEKGARRAMIDATRCVVVSPSTGCDVTVMADSTTSLKDSHVSVPLNVAGCHRYRRACAPDVYVGCKTAPHNVTPIKDNTMLRFQPRLKFPVIQALKDSGTVDKAGLYQVAINADA